jgi:hypothetical protein
LTAPDLSIEDALDALYDRVDGALLAGNFAAVDRELAAVDVGTTELTLLLGWLTITYAARERLPLRARFAVRVFLRAEREQGTDAAVELLRGLVDEKPPPLLRLPLAPEEPLNERAFKVNWMARYGGPSALTPNADTARAVIRAWEEWEDRRETALSETHAPVGKRRD